MFEMDYFLIIWLRDEIESFSIWYSNGGKDGLVCNNEKEILCFLDESAALLYLSEKDLHLYDPKDAPTIYDIDRLEAWIHSDSATVDCNEILNFWNMFTDVSYTTGVKFKGDKKKKLTNLIYNKLFYGLNLPSIKPEDEEDWMPVWDKRQLKIMKSIMENGLNILNQNFIYIPQYFAE